MNITETIKILCTKRNIPISQLAELTEQTKQNFSGKMIRNNWRIDELNKICQALNYSLALKITDKTTGEEVNI